MNKLVRAMAAIGASLGVCLSFAACGEKSAAPVPPPDNDSSYSIITKLDLNIGFEDNTVFGTVKNSFTLFPATATVYLYLYFSESYTTDYSEMREVANSYTEDLDMKNTLTATYEMQGESGYFLARMRYKIDSRDWQERTTDAYKRDYSGIYMQTIEDDGSLPVFEDIEPAVPYIYYGDYKGYERIYKEEYFSKDILSLYYEEVQTSLDFEKENIEKYTQSIGKKFFLFTPKDKTYNSWARHIEYKVFEKENEYVFTKSMLLAVPEFDYLYKPEPDELTGIGVWNIDFDIKFIDISGLDLNGKLKLKFGKWDSPLKGDKYIVHDDKFINLYIGETCIGTCYYDTTSIKDVTYPFFYNLFAEGLRII